MAERHHRLPSVHPRDPCLTDSPSCTHHPHPLLGAIEGCNSSRISFFYCLLYWPKMHFFLVRQGFLCEVKHGYCGAAEVVTRDRAAGRLQGKLVLVVFSVSYDQLLLSYTFGVTLERERTADCRMSIFEIDNNLSSINPVSVTSCPTIIHYLFIFICLSSCLSGYILVHHRASLLCGC